ncbi:hypothetical protein B0H14DRAFT_1324705 [Mycena olivaceomarginata]|nr:hypothetical protein B0H14DRAFT_1324705 [Mycena olivaceomarginata]
MHATHPARRRPHQRTEAMGAPPRLTPPPVPDTAHTSLCTLNPAPFRGSRRRPLESASSPPPTTIIPGAEGRSPSSPSSAPGRESASGPPRTTLPPSSSSRTDAANVLPMEAKPSSPSSTSANGRGPHSSSPHSTTHPARCRPHQQTEAGGSSSPHSTHKRTPSPRLFSSPSLPTPQSLPGPPSVEGHRARPRMGGDDLSGRAPSLASLQPLRFDPERRK